MFRGLTVFDDVQVQLFDDSGRPFKVCYGSVTRGADDGCFYAEFFADNFYFRLGCSAEKNISRSLVSGLKKYLNYDFKVIRLT